MMGVISTAKRLLILEERVKKLEGLCIMWCGFRKLGRIGGIARPADPVEGKPAWGCDKIREVCVYPLIPAKCPLWGVKKETGEKKAGVVR